MGFHAILHGIFPTQGSNLCFLHWQAGFLFLVPPRSSDFVSSAIITTIAPMDYFKTNFQQSYDFMQRYFYLIQKGFPDGSDDKESACSSGDPSLIRRLRRSPGEGNGYPVQFSCLENSMDRRIWWATVHGVSKS